MGSIFAIFMFRWKISLQNMASHFTRDARTAGPFYSTWCKLLSCSFTRLFLMLKGGQFNGLVAKHSAAVRTMHPPTRDMYWHVHWVRGNVDSAPPLYRGSHTHGLYWRHLSSNCNVTACAFCLKWFIPQQIKIQEKRTYNRFEFWRHPQRRSSHQTLSVNIMDLNSHVSNCPHSPFPPHYPWLGCKKSYHPACQG